MGGRRGIVRFVKRSLCVFVVLCLVTSACFLSQRASAADTGTTVPRTVLIELFTATWCGPCGAYGHNMDELVHEFGTDKVMLLRNQVWQDSLDTAETNSRCSQYGVKGVPACKVDGVYSSNPIHKESIAGHIATELREGSPVKLSISSISNTASSGTATVTATPVAPVTGDVRLFAVALQEVVNFTGTNGVPQHHYVVRKYLTPVAGMPVSLRQGGALTRELSYSIDSSWKTDHVACAAWLQIGTTGQVLQSAWTLADTSSEEKPEWKAMRGGLYGGDVDGLAQDPVDPAVFYAACGAGGLWISADSGHTWTDCNTNLGGRYKVNLVRSSIDSSGLVWIACENGIMVSGDHGLTWRASKCVSSDIFALVPLISGGAVACGRQTGIVQLSADGSRADPVSPPASQLPSSFYYTGFGASQTDGQVIALNGYSLETMTRALMRTDNGGRTWVQLAIPAFISSVWGLQSILIHPGAPSWMLATYNGTGLCSTDLGKTWNVVAASGFEYIYQLLERPTDGKVMALTDAGVLLLSGDGINWNTQVMTHTMIYPALVCDKSDARRLVGSGSGGVLVSENAGSTWVSSSGLTVWSVWGLMGPATAPFALTDSGAGSWQGKSWRLSASSLPRSGFFCLDPDHCDRAVFMNTSLQASGDGGRTWNRILSAPWTSNDYLTGLSYDFASDTALMLCSSGHIWAALKGATPRLLDLRGIPDVVSLTDVAFAGGQSGDSFLVGTNYDYDTKQGGVYRVVHSGETWSATCIRDGWTTGVWADPHHEGTWYANIDNKLERTADAGRTWQTILAGSFGAVAFYRDGKYVYAGAGSTLWCSDDAGATWNEVLWDRSAEPCVPGSISSILIDAEEPRNVTLGTQGTGVYRCQRVAQVPVPGTVNIAASLDGLPWTGAVNVQMSGSSTAEITSVPFSVSVPEGDVTIARISGGPSGADFAGVTPSQTRTVDSGTTVTFILAFRTPVPIVPEPHRTVITLTINSAVAAVDGGPVALDAPAEITASRTFVPIRFIAEAFGADVQWLAASKGIVIRLGSHTISLQVGEQTAVVDGIHGSLDAVPYIRNGRTMVPLRFISEALGSSVVWDPATKTATITYTS